jgi:hypothetical protein
LPTRSVRETKQVVKLTLWRNDNTADEVGDAVQFKCGICSVDIEEHPDVEELLDLYVHFEPFFRDEKSRDKEMEKGTTH